MKVVLFCGGLGTRLREYSDTVPKPLVNVGPRPIMWHIMRYYAHYGHKDFILCLGYQGQLIRDFFLNYNPYMTNDFVMKDGGRTVIPADSDIADWTITFVDTGLHSNIGERLLAVREYLDGEDGFLANYTDQLTDLPLDTYVTDVVNRGRIANFISVRPPQSYHSVSADNEGNVESLVEVKKCDFWVNGGYFVFRKEIFDYIEPGEELVHEPFARLAGAKQLWTMKYDGFWRPMDTFKDKITFDRMAGQGDCPWRVWEG